MGVYVIRNRANDRVYVGSSVRIEFRWRDHQAALAKGAHSNSELQADWSRLGDSHFELIVLEQVGSTRSLRPAEQRWVDHFRSTTGVYNRNFPIWNRKPGGDYFDEKTV